jgi:RNA recognition motif-containing protein
MSKVKTLYISNIPVAVNETTLTSLFQEYGPIKNCVIVKSQQTKQPKGFAFLEFEVSTSVLP